MASVYVFLAQCMWIYLCRGEIVNIARNKPVDMSSIHGDRFPPEKAVDGITVTDINSIIHTSVLTTTPAWWWVDLQTQVQDATVTIYFRTDDGRLRRNGVQLFTSTTFSTNPDGQLCHMFTGTNIPDVDSVNCTGTWRYLLVYKTSKTNNTDNGPVLDFGEVEVLVCSNGTYGQNCTNVCSSRQCIMPSLSCDRYTGTCPGGCKAGWMGTDCITACSIGTYGLNCEGSCKSHQCAVTSVPCDHITGACPPRGCKPGWMEANCTQACVATYGPECSMSCDDRQCVSSSSSCHHVTGTCEDGCKPGWSGVDCSRSQSVDSASTVTTYVIGAVIGAVVMLAMIGGVILILFRIGRLQCTKTPFSLSEREMTAVSSQPPQSVSAHIYNNDYAVLGVDAKSENNVYDDIKLK